MTSSSTYTKKRIVTHVVISGESSERVFDGFATRVTIDKTACPAMPKATVTIKGLSLETMATMTRLGWEAYTSAKNSIAIYAGENNQLSLAYKGEIVTAWANFNSAPSIEFTINALGGSYPNLIPQSPLSVKGQQTAEETISTLCKQIDYSFENNGVTASISNCIIEGDPITKIKKVAEMVGANVIIDNETIAIMPNGGVRNTKGVPSITAENGLIGYPTFNEKGITFNCFYRPELAIGGLVSVKSVVPRASGLWIVTGLKHDLAAFDPSSNAWKTEVQAIFPQYGA